MKRDQMKGGLMVLAILIVVSVGTFLFLMKSNEYNKLTIVPTRGFPQYYKVKSCRIDLQTFEIEYSMYDNNENVSKVLVKDGIAYEFDKTGFIVKIFSDFKLKYTENKKESPYLYSSKRYIDN